MIATNQPIHNRRIASLVFFGLIIAIVPVALLREAWETAAGDELALALGLTVWLLGMVLGAALGRLAPVRLARGLLSLAGFLLVMAPFAAIMLARALPGILHLSSGELLSLPQQLAVLLLILLPVSLLGGAIFTVAGRLPDINPRSVYAAEAAGWLLGGLAATWLFVITQPFAVFSMMAYFILAAVLLLWPTRWAPAAVALFGFCFGFILPFSTDSLDELTLNWRWPEQEVIDSAYTRHGHGVILEKYGQRALYVNGHLALTLPERQNAEKLANLALLQVERPMHVLLIGGLGGLLPEVLKHPVYKVTLAEEDPNLAELAYDYTDIATRATAKFPNIRRSYGDPRRLVNNEEQAWDAILIDIPSPTTALANRCYTVEFFRDARRALHRGGVLAFVLPGKNTINNEELLERNSAIYRALADIFPYLAVTPLGTNYLLASDTPLTLDPAELSRRLKERNIDERLGNDYLFADIAMRELTKRYQSGHDVNSDEAPVAYLHSVMVRQRLPSGRLAGFFSSLAVRSSWQAGIMLFCLLLVGGLAPAAVWRRGWPARWGTLLSVAILGFVGMASSVLLLLIAQQSLGTLYLLLGALTAPGMAGIALGMWASARIGQWGLRGLILLEMLLAIVLPSLAASLPGWPFILAILVLGFGMLLAGSAVGALFTRAVSAGISPGIVHAVSLLGAVLAGLSIGTLLLPMRGLWTTALFLAVMLVIAILSLFRFGHSSGD